MTSPSTLRERLAEDAGPVERADLAAHAKRGGLVLVALVFIDDHVRSDRCVRSK